MVLSTGVTSEIEKVDLDNVLNNYYHLFTKKVFDVNFKGSVNDRYSSFFKAIGIWFCQFNRQKAYSLKKIV